MNAIAVLSAVLAVTIGPARTDESKTVMLVVKDKAIYGTLFGTNQFRNCNGLVFERPQGAQVKSTSVTCAGDDFKPYSGHGKFSPKAKHSPRPRSA